MNLMVPTFMVKALSATEFESRGRTIKVGEILDVSYGQALIMKAMGGVTAIVDEFEMHVKAQEQLAIYGADCFFPAGKQTISRVADYLAGAGIQTNTVN